MSTLLTRGEHRGTHRGAGETSLGVGTHHTGVGVTTHHTGVGVTIRRIGVEATIHHIGVEATIRHTGAEATTHHIGAEVTSQAIPFTTMTHVRDTTAATITAEATDQAAVIARAAVSDDPCRHRTVRHTRHLQPLTTRPTFVDITTPTLAPAVR